MVFSPTEAGKLLQYFSESIGTESRELVIFLEFLLVPLDHLRPPPSHLNLSTNI